MHSVLRERLWRKLDALPEERLYQVLDYIEFLESRYAERAAPPPGGLQRFAERLEDGMRARRVAPTVMLGTMRVMGAAARVVDGVTATGRQLLTPPPPRTGSPAAKAPNNASAQTARPHGDDAGGLTGNTATEEGSTDGKNQG